MKGALGKEPGRIWDPEGVKLGKKGREEKLNWSHDEREKGDKDAERRRSLVRKIWATRQKTYARLRNKGPSRLTGEEGFKN